jgi:glutathione S-transferase
MLELWELGGRGDCRFSTFAWRTRLALHHKALSFDVHPVAVSDKAAIDFSGQDKVPILRHDDRIIADSWAIALYLEREFPLGRSLFGGPVGETLTHFFNLWTDRELIPALVPYLMRDVLDCVNAADAAHLRAQIEGVFKKSLEQLADEREKALPAFRRKLQPVRKILQQKKYLGGDEPTYADYILFGVLQWSRVISLTRVLEPDDAVAAWFDRVLDLHDGVGRRELPRAERMQETAA